MKKFFENLTIRDAELKPSSTYRIDSYQSKTIVLNNTLDKDVEVKIYGIILPDISLDILVATLTIPATTLSYETLLDYFPFMKMTAKCSIAPATGFLSVYLLAMEEN